MRFKKGFIREMLEDYGVEKINASGANLTCCCPLPEHKDHNPSFSINEETGLWLCFGCGKRGNYFHFISLMEGITYKEAKDNFRNNFSQHYYNRMIEDSLESLERNEQEEKSFTVNLTTLPINKYADWLQVLNKLNIKPEIALKFGLSICEEEPYKKRLAIPIYENGTLFWELRDLTKKSAKKCLYTKGTKTGKILYECVVDKNNPFGFLCEGTKDALTVAGYGFNSFSCFGLNISERQMSLILKSGIKKLYILYDSDEPGVQGAERNYKYIHNFIDCKIIKYPKDFGFKDPNEIREEKTFFDLLKLNI